MVNQSQSFFFKKNIFLGFIIVLFAIILIVNNRYSIVDLLIYVAIQILILIMNRQNIKIYAFALLVTIFVVILREYKSISNDLFHTIAFVITFSCATCFLRTVSIEGKLVFFTQLYVYHIVIVIMFIVILTFLKSIDLFFLSSIDYLLESLLIVLYIFILVYSVLTLLRRLKKGSNRVVYLNLNDEMEYSETISKVLLFFNNEKTEYVKTDFTISKLSNKINIPISDISKKINQELKVNYYTVVAYYRIQYCKELLIKEPDYKIEVIAKDCGFNSKSTFIKYFKLFEKCTPSEFRMKR